MIGVKHIVAIARNSGQLAINPLAGYLISPEQKDRGFLNKEELNLLVNAKMKNTQYELVRDLFVFSCFTGLSYSDVKSQTKENLKTSFDGHLWIITRRQKNKHGFQYPAIGSTQTDNRETQRPYERQPFIPCYEQ